MKTNIRHVLRVESLARPLSFPYFVAFKLLPIINETATTMIDDFNAYRQRMNDVILSHDNKVIKRFFSLDNQTYEDGALPEVTKELLGLVSSMVLRCDDCIKYHLGRCHELGVTKAQIYETCSVALIVGGSIFIPHMRRAAEYWEALEDESKNRSEA